MAELRPSRRATRSDTPGTLSTHDPVLVIGLGRFGSALAVQLAELGHEVLGVDADPALVQRHSRRLTQAVEADATDPLVLEQLGAGDFPCAVVGIGTGIEKYSWAITNGEPNSQGSLVVAGYHHPNPGDSALSVRYTGPVAGGGRLDFIGTYQG